MLNVNRRDRLVQDALQHIRHSIVQGKYRPRERLIAATLSDELHMSRTPVREALKLLELQGYLSRTRGGLLVADHTSEQVQGLYEIREALECAAIELACQKWSGRQLGRAAAHCDQLEKTIRLRNIAQIVDLNTAFHHDLYAVSGNERLCALIETYRDLFFDARLARAYAADDWEITIAQHRDVMEAVRRRDSVTAKTVVREHLNKSKKAVLERL